MVTYGAPITPDDLPDPDGLDSPVLRIAVERAKAASKPRHRDDPHTLAIAIEGGGMGGAVSAGMCVMLEALGLVASFDSIYGCSSGALNGLWTAAGQAAMGATTYEDAACRQFISLTHLLKARPVVNLPFLFDQVALMVKPFSYDNLLAGPDFNTVVTSVERREVAVLRDFSSPQEILAAARASCALPVLAGALPTFRGELVADGGLVEAVPFQSALRDGASHVLVLRSRSASHRKKPVGRATLAIVRRQHAGLAELLAARPARYNAAADRLAGLADDPVLGEKVLQVSVPDLDVLGRLEHNCAKVTAALHAGARAMAFALLGTSTDLLWQPQPYRTKAVLEEPAAARWRPSKLPFRPAHAPAGVGRPSGDPGKPAPGDAQ